MRSGFFVALVLIVGISAECPKECPEMYQPVCASNGRTYGNKCEFEMAFCSSEEKVFVVSEGECKTETRHPTQPTRPPTEPALVTDPEGSGETETPDPTETKMPTTYMPTKTFRPQNYTRYPPVTRSPCARYYCPGYYSPICGADGVTYNNTNCFSKAACEYRLKGLNLRYMYRGPCRSGTVFKPLSKYCPYKSCPYSRVCGSDGKTYTSVCSLENSNCRYNRNVTVVKKGSCPPQSTMAPTGKPRCVYNGTLCPVGGQRYPVCGTDGRSYFTVCYLEFMNCVNNMSVSVASKGKCPYKTTTPKPCSKNCGWTYAPVCGSDGNTYRSPCLLENTACRLQYIGQKLTVNYKGICKPQPTTSKPMTGKPSSACSNMGRCPTYYRPVCASNNVTYRNTCFFSQAECKMVANGMELKLTGIGECKKAN